MLILKQNKMSKKVKNGLVNEVEVETTTAVDQLPTQVVEANEATEEAVSTGHGTRAFRS